MAGRDRRIVCRVALSEDGRGDPAHRTDRAACCERDAHAGICDERCGAGETNEEEGALSGVLEAVEPSLHAPWHAHLDQLHLADEQQRVAVAGAGERQQRGYHAADDRAAAHADRGQELGRDVAPDQEARRLRSLVRDERRRGDHAQAVARDEQRVIAAAPVQHV